MDAAFNNLQKEGKNDVDNLMKWIKDSKVINQTKEQEDKARSFFNDVPDKKNVSLDTFKSIIAKIANEFKINLDGISKKLTESGPKFLQSAMGGGATSAVKNLFK